MRKLPMLPDRVPMLPDRVKSNPTGRAADPRRTIPLNSQQWRKLRALVLSWSPLCRMCGAVATDVDHVSGDPSDNRQQNLQALCHPCHSHKTGRERMGLAVQIRGHDANGTPLDPNHPWNLEKSPVS
jgi:5-methylcytosine-specific restriction protein A